MHASRMTASLFGEDHFGDARLGDVGRQRRLVVSAAEMAKHPGGTLPSKMNDPADLKAFHRLMNSDTVTHETVLQPHVDRTLDGMRAHDGVVLILHDTTELDDSGLKSLKDELGQIGNGGGRGDKCHNSLAVTAESGEVLGLTQLFSHVQCPCEKTHRRGR